MGMDDSPFEELVHLLNRQEAEMGKLLKKVKAQQQEIAVRKVENEELIASLESERQNTAAALQSKSENMSTIIKMGVTIHELKHENIDTNAKLEAVEFAKVGSTTIFLTRCKTVAGVGKTPR